MDLDNTLGYQTALAALVNNGKSTNFGLNSNIELFLNKKNSKSSLPNSCSEFSDNDFDSSVTSTIIANDTLNTASSSAASSTLDGGAASEDDTMDASCCDDGVGGASINDWKPIRSRSFLTDNQVQVLSQQFKRNRLPSKYELSALAEQIGVNRRVVQVNFVFLIVLI